MRSSIGLSRGAHLLLAKRPQRCRGNLEWLEAASAAQCQHIRAIAVERLAAPVGNVGPEALTQMREVLADLLDL